MLTAKIVQGFGKRDYDLCNRNFLPTNQMHDDLRSHNLQKNSKHQLRPYSYMICREKNNIEIIETDAGQAREAPKNAQ